MSYWKTKVLPTIKRYFFKSGKKKRAAAEASKSFESLKESIEKELEEKREELGPKVIEIYESSDVETKALVKQPTNAGITEHPNYVQTLLKELVKIGFPGAPQVSEAAEKYGPALVLGPITFILQKTFTFITEKSEVAAPGESSEPKTEIAVETAEPEMHDVPTVVERKTGDDVVTEKAEFVKETPADDGQTVRTVQVTETVPVQEPTEP